MFTLEDVECVAACTEAPAIQVNYRFRYKVTSDDFDQLVDDLRADRWQRRSRPTARWPASVRRWPPTAGRAPARQPRRRWTPDE
jgi:hypothetical protein